jgi:hypothetical protein
MLQLAAVVSLCKSNVYHVLIENAVQVLLVDPLAKNCPPAVQLPPLSIFNFAKLVLVQVFPEAVRQRAITALLDGKLFTLIVPMTSKEEAIPVNVDEMLAAAFRGRLICTEFAQAVLTGAPAGLEMIDCPGEPVTVQVLLQLDGPAVQQRVEESPNVSVKCAPVGAVHAPPLPLPIIVFPPETIFPPIVVWKPVIRTAMAIKIRIAVSRLITLPALR